MRVLLRLWQDTDGQDMVEYTLLLFFIGTASVGLLLALPENIAAIWGKAQSQFNTAVNIGKPGGSPGL